MKRLTLLAVFSIIFLSALAQKNNNARDDDRKSKQEREWKKDRDWKNDRDDGDDDDDRYRAGKERRNDRYAKWEKERRKEMEKNRGRKYERRDNGKNGKAVPARVRRAFREDFPQAKNTRWSSYRNEWTANFETGLFNRSRTVTYNERGRVVERTLVYNNY